MAVWYRLKSSVLQVQVHFSLLGDVEKELRQIFGVPEEVECRVWHRYMTSTYELLSNHNSTLQDVGLYSGQVAVQSQLMLSFSQII